jgi:NAD+ diphosphatase
MHYFAFRGNELLVREEGDRLRLPSGEELLAERVAQSEHETGFVRGERCVALALPAEWEPRAGMRLVGLRALYGALDEPLYGMAGRAVQLVEWARTHRFCGHCATPTVPGADALAKLCPACGLNFYPRISPAVIVLISRGSELLLARSPHFAEGLYSTLAGFVEPGESLEDAVRREVREEVGVEVTEPRYFGSQPWPYPNSLMIGFTAEYASGELAPQETEIADAGWFALDQLPLVPRPLSIARQLIDHFVRSHGGDPRLLRSSR